MYQFLSSFLFLWFINTAVAQNIQTTLGSFNSSSCAVGDTITLPVNVSMASGISTAAISMAIDYDKVQKERSKNTTSSSERGESDENKYRNTNTKNSSSENSSSGSVSDPGLGKNTSWWRIGPSEMNDKTFITEDDAYTDPTMYSGLIKEIQRELLNQLDRSGFNQNVNGSWNSYTSKAIQRFKDVKGYEWESGPGGDSICRSFYKTLVYGSMDEVTLLSRCIADVCQRPRILQEAWEKNGDKQNLNAWANAYSKSWVDHMDDFQKLCRIDWQHVNSFENYKKLGIDEEFLTKICPSDISSIYFKLFNKKPEGGTKLDQNYKILLAVINEIRRQDAIVIKKAFQ